MFIGDSWFDNTTNIYPVKVLSWDILISYLWAMRVHSVLIATEQISLYDGRLTI